jgi:tetratricopeptide (TPR) repeat protein/type II secretory pathway predicted ATPase ExeA
VPTEGLFPPARFSIGERRTLLIGRAAEMRELDRAYQSARETRTARTVTLVGATGIGKTRLVRDFLVRLREERTSARVYRGVAREGGPAYEIFARVLRARFGIVEGMDAEAAKAQVRAQVAAVLEDRKVGDVAYFLGQLLDLRFLDSPLIKALEGDPQPMRSMRRAVIKNFLETDSGKESSPVVLVYDDLQWAHDDSLELLSYLVESLHGPILLVCMARPEMLARREGWRRYGGERHKTIELAPLGETDAAAAMHDQLAPCGEAPEVEELVDAAVNLAGGNPALLEQIVRIYHDTGVLEVTDDFEDERWSIRVDRLAHVRLPLTVEDAVQARIAALAPAERALLERAAAMGGVFWLGGLIAIHRLSGAPPEVWEGGEAEDVVVVRRLLSELVDRDYLLRLPDSAFAGDEEFVFKHNLEREALVRLTSPAAAKQYHRAIAEWLSFRESGDAGEEFLEMLGRHRERGGAIALAASSFVQAGEVARSRYANAKAAELFARGLELLSQCEHPDEHLRLKALHQYGDVLQSVGRNDAAFQAFLEMLTRAWRLDLRSKGGAAHSRIGRLYRETGRLEQAGRQLTAALALFGQAQDDRGIASTLDDIGKLHWLKGDYALALEYTVRALAMRRKLGDRRSIALSLNNLGLVQQDSGNYEAALDSFDQALRIRREIGDLVGVSVTLNNLGTVAQDTRDDRRALGLFEEAYEVAKETGDRNRIALILTNVGETHNRLGDAEKAITLLKQAEDLADELGDRLGLAEAERGLGKAYLARREYTRARECTQRAVELFRETESRVQLGVALRSLGEVTAAASAGGSGLGEAAEHLRRSIAIFEEVRNEVELARSWRSYSELLRQMPGHEHDPALVEEATLFARRAEEVFAKMRASAAALTGQAIFAR